MMMVLESQISVHFTEFSTIFKKITSNEYSDEQKHEMMEFFKTQTKERHLDLINKLALGPGDDLDKIGETAISVLTMDRQAEYGCKDLFLSLLDGAISSVVFSPGRKYEASSRPVSNTAYLDGEVDNYRRKNDKLVEEIQLLRSELEERMTLLDNLQTKNRNLTGIKEQFGKVLDRCTSLEVENDSLKSQLFVDQNKYRSRLEEALKSEEKMKNEITSLEDSISVKRYLIKSFENEKEIMISDFQLLSEEVVERDLIIQSLNEDFSEERNKESRENLAFLLDTAASESTYSDLSSSTTRLFRTPKKSCEDCAKEINNSLLLDLNLRRRNNSFDDSTNSLFATAEALKVFPSRPKSINEELNEIQKAGRETSCDKRKIQMTELVGKMYLLEVELKKSRETFEKSSKKLLGSQNANKMLRFRVENGKLTKMMFTTYTGVRIN